MKYVLVAVLIILLIVMSVGWSKYLLLHTNVALGEEQAQYFKTAVTEGLASKETNRIVSLMEGIELYYPSGSKQRTGSHVDAMVESARSLALISLSKHLTNVSCLLKVPQESDH